MLGLTVVIVARRSRSTAPRFQFGERYTWIPAFGVHFAFGVDGIALVLIAADRGARPAGASSRSLETTPTSRRAAERSNTYFALLLALEGTMIGVFAAADVFLFYVFFEAMLIPMYFLSASFGGAAAPVRRGEVPPLLAGRRAAHAGRGDRPLRRVRGGHTFVPVSDADQLDIDTGAERWLFLGFFLAFAIKAPLLPFHTWLPDAGGAAPPGAAVLLVGVLDKVGTFGYPALLPAAVPGRVASFAPLAIALALIGIIYGALLAIGQNDIKRLMAYTSMAHFGFIGMGIFALHHPGRDRRGAVHGQPRPLHRALFLVAGYADRAARLGAGSRLRRRRKVLPLLAGLFLFAGLSRSRCPALRRSSASSWCWSARSRAQGGRGDRHARHRAGRAVRAVDVPAHHAGHTGPELTGSTRMRKDLNAARGRSWSPR